MKNVTAFILGALAIMALDMVWASKGYAQAEIACTSNMHGVTQVFPCCVCPIGWNPA